MAYKSLAKLYYSDPQNYTQIYKNRFVSTESVHINFSVAKNPMFFFAECRCNVLGLPHLYVG